MVDSRSIVREWEYAEKFDELRRLVGSSHVIPRRSHGPHVSDAQISLRICALYGDTVIADMSTYTSCMAPMDFWTRDLGLVRETLQRVLFGRCHPLRRPIQSTPGRTVLTLAQRRK
jgi:hypothetical protein